LNYTRKGLLDELAGVYGLSFAEYLAAERPYMDSEQVRKLVAEGFHLGSHSIDHPLFRDISLGEQIRQTGESLNILKRRFGLTRNLFSFPFTAGGVTDEYYKSVRSENLVDIFFGAGHFGGNVELPVYERMPFDERAPGFLKSEYLMYIRRKYVGSHLPAPFG
jgi:peptidoglycan/xylan/chitin deacetylase (PgdA/CDA1 family)